MILVVVNPLLRVSRLRSQGIVVGPRRAAAIVDRGGRILAR
jgi:hypothetical protein